MLRVGLVGLGFMGRGHLDNYLRFEKEGYPVQLVAVCDVNPVRLTNAPMKGNMDDVGASEYDFSKYTAYTDLDEMLEKEALDCVDIALPTYLHAWGAVKAMEAGCHVLCEKPMAISTKECDEMIDASQRTGKFLMIGQCLRFWPAYEYVKEVVDDKRFGEVTCAYFYRGGGTPIWSFENWLLQKDKSGGALLDQHIHDVDTVQWLLGTPLGVSTSARNILPGSGYDAVSTNYIYPDGKVVNAQDDWTINGDYGFQMIFRINFETGSAVLLPDGKLWLYPHSEAGFTPDLNPDTGYYREMRYFYDCVQSNTRPTVASPESTRETIRIAEAEVQSADNGSQRIDLP